MANEVREVRMVERSGTRSAVPPPAGTRGGQVQEVRAPSSGAALRSSEEVPALSRPGRLPPRGSQRAGLPAAEAQAIRPGALAIRQALSPLESAEGFRLGLLGDSGCGKSFLAVAVVEEYLRRSRGIVAVANSKGDPWPTSGVWPSETHKTVGALVEHPPVKRVIVLTPDDFEESLDLEEVARWQWRVARKGWPSLGVYDEISDACKEGEFLPTWDDGRAELPRVWTHGRRPQVSGLWGAQFAQQVPREPYEQANMLFVWRQAGNALAILKRRHYLEGDGVEHAILSLPGVEVPPAERGAFVVLRRARPWDGCIYRL